MKLTTFSILALSTLGLSAQPHVSLPHLLFIEDFSSYAGDGSMPTTVGDGGLWGTAAWNGASGSAGVVVDSGNLFGQGTSNQFFQASSTNNLNPGLITPDFVPQDVLSFAFDFIGSYPTGDGNRWVNVDARSAGLAAHVTSMRMSNATIRTSAPITDGTISYGGNDMPVRIWTIVNNRDETIGYDTPDGLGTANLSSAHASVWLYDYSDESWSNVLPEYIFGRNAAMTTGAIMDNVRVFMDSNAPLRTFAIDNIEVYGAIPEPSTYALIFGLGVLGAAWIVRRRRK